MNKLYYYFFHFRFDVESKHEAFYTGGNIEVSKYKFFLNRPIFNFSCFKSHCIYYFYFF